MGPGVGELQGVGEPVENVESDHMVRGQDARIKEHEDQGRKLLLIRFIQPIYSILSILNDSTNSVQWIGKNSQNLSIRCFSEFL